MKNKRLTAIGETQSKKPTLTDTNKTATLAQARIYGVGELTKVSHNNIPVVVFFKDKSAQVAVASRMTPTTPMLGSVGAVSDKLVQRVDSLSLKKDDLQDFGWILVSTLRWSMAVDASQ